ncbi:hypothetical protein [Croceimicrobium hydrocarbonivorans]|uniref:Lipoprotein n=1 Tax=Croceimicrobium hydrocarbonivorans TaxID=2761580 RepID=A0A7H0VDW8_9FLAO|nr:hypothetical protein [Croceimicrobium hydrocarbonivorans]QNR23916.1 hypothetical protein H4K34_16290 [Croceimicrobium hydrocarbonivorans]
MKKALIFLVLILMVLSSCVGPQSENEKNPPSTSNNQADQNFKEVLAEIKSSEIYEKSENWLARGLNPSDQKVIRILRRATDDFLEKLETIYFSNESRPTKQRQISRIVDELPWDELDTEE